MGTLGTRREDCLPRWNVPRWTSDRSVGRLPEAEKMAELCRELGDRRAVARFPIGADLLRSDSVVLYCDGLTRNQCFEPPHALVEVTVLATAKFAPVSETGDGRSRLAPVVCHVERPCRNPGHRAVGSDDFIDVEIPFDVRIGPVVLIAADRKTTEPPAGRLASRFNV